MTKKSYNQIIFLTTLSVYLGLVLVGSSPQILAQTALTAKFEIKDQIEQQNDLDKNDDEIEVTGNTELAESFVEFTKIFEAQNQSNGLSFFSKDSAYDNFQNVSVNSFLANEDSFSLNLKLSPSKSEINRQSLISLADFLACKTKEKQTNIQPLTENLSFPVENNQVFVVTRFPRASIDSPAK